MAKSFTARKRIRKSFGRIAEVAPLPNLIEVQKASYDTFLLQREDESSRLEEVFKSVFPIRDFSDRGSETGDVQVTGGAPGAVAREHEELLVL